MLRRIRPAVDETIVPQGGISRDGQPLSYNRGPAADLAPWIARLYVTIVTAPENHLLDSSLFNDTCMVRIQLKGDWTARTADGEKQYGRAALIFGPHSKAMPVKVTGSFVSVGISLRPGTGHALIRLDTSEIIDRLITCDELGLPGNAALEAVERCTTPEECLQTLEAHFRAVVAAANFTEPDPVSARFELVSLTDPSVSIADFAEDCGISQRQLERIIRRDFGLPPKQVLRRARALDMASALRGVADQAEADDLVLRYYDQSHLIREFAHFFGMAPRQFMKTPQPILTLALESRQAWRLEALERISPGQPRPWQ